MSDKKNILKFKAVISSSDENKVLEALSEKHQESYSFDDIALLKKVAVNTSDDDFVTFYQTGELPAIELSESEMDMIHGGGGIKKLINLIVMGAAAYISGYFGEKHGNKDP